MKVMGYQWGREDMNNLIEKYLGEAKNDFDPLAILMGKDKKAKKEKINLQKIKKGIISDLTKFFIKYKNELQKLDAKKYKENSKKIIIGGTKDDFQSFDMSITTINNIRKQRKMKGLLDTLKLISSVEPKLKKAIDMDDIKDGLAPLIDDALVDVANYAEKQYKKLGGEI
jgi:hypothetical protein